MTSLARWFSSSAAKVSSISLRLSSTSPTRGEGLSKGLGSDSFHRDGDGLDAEVDVLFCFGFRHTEQHGIGEVGIEGQKWQPADDLMLQQAPIDLFRCDRQPDDKLLEEPRFLSIDRNSRQFGKATAHIGGFLQAEVGDLAQTLLAEFAEVDGRGDRQQ